MAKASELTRCFIKAAAIHTQINTFDERERRKRVIIRKYFRIDSTWALNVGGLTTTFKTSFFRVCVRLTGHTTQKSIFKRRQR